MDNYRSRNFLQIGIISVVLGIFLCGTAGADPGKTALVSADSSGTDSGDAGSSSIVSFRMRTEVERVGDGYEC